MAKNSINIDQNVETNQTYLHTGSGYFAYRDPLRKNGSRNP
jgi:hypothetical protein